jgi:hypothetical protein
VLQFIKPGGFIGLVDIAFTREVACAADEIHANRMSVVGSIGVVGGSEILGVPVTDLRRTWQARD